MKSLVSSMCRAAGLALGASLLVSLPLLAQSQTQLRKQAKVTYRQARHTALAKEPGRILSHELEHEDGRVIYTFTIHNRHGYHEVNVDARTGRLLEDSRESRAEALADIREARHDRQRH
jgi:hypothetical protein